MPKTKLPNVVLEPIEIESQEDNMEDMVTYSKKEEQNPFVEPEPKPVKVEPPLNYNNLTAKKLREICKQNGYRNYSKLKKCDLIKMLNGEEVYIPEKIKVIPKVEKTIPKVIPKKTEELKNNLEKDEVLIKDDLDIQNDISDKEVHKTAEPTPKQIPQPKPKPKPKQPTQQPQPLPKQQPTLPKQQPMLPKQKPKELYNPFTNYYNIM